ncbi:nose resistant to fluoxetine protein 6-like [Plodia interpunctella]|uniref:nose resistant to fluoxetine protein 6-like n=1 Tax=Plodia interpunctella TaxID=58824 RepID=UPI002368A2E5|nr:nose resistant to fluoxetine protein 6-like [Plodia interpunctella]
MELHILCILLAILSAVDARLNLKKKNTVFDQALYEEVLDPELCHQQVMYLNSDTVLKLRFIDAGLRLPRSVLMVNLVDLGNYHQCLGIDEVRADHEIKGKYCMVRIPLNQGIDIDIPGLSKDNVDELLNKRIKEAQESLEYENMVHDLRGDFERMDLETFLSQLSLRLAVCIPRPCSVQQAMTSALFNLSAVGFQFEEDFCRLPGDKPWSPADYTAIVLFSVIGLITVLSTCYDLNHCLILKQDPKQANVLYRSFSVYTNAKRLTSFPSNSIQCLDGIRTLAMLWVIVGHTFITENFLINQLEAGDWIASAKSLWITLAPFSVDTFYFITGILLVYTTAGKLTRAGLIKNLHLFYLNRLLRLFPLLALTVLLQASLLNHMFDGPYWINAGNQVHNCRQYWWTTLLHIQNYATPSSMCLPHSWYLAIDIQLHIISPVVLYWVLNKNRKVAWTVLTVTLCILFSTTTYYNAYKQFPGNNVVLSRTVEDYMPNYYMNTFTRAAPFFVGMIFGYILNTWKGNAPKIHPGLVVLFWTLTFTIFGLISYAIHEVVQRNFDNLVVDVIMATYSRSAWAAALGWMIFACVNGYGGPINWFLSLDMWKLPARLSYAMFLLHYPLQYTINAKALAPVYFDVAAFTFKSLAYITLTFIVCFFACLLIDAPCSVLFKMILGGGVKKEKSTAKADPPSGELATTSHKSNGIK